MQSKCVPLNSTLKSNHPTKSHPLSSQNSNSSQRITLSFSHCNFLPSTGSFCSLLGEVVNWPTGHSPSTQLKTEVLFISATEPCAIIMLHNVKRKWKINTEEKIKLKGKFRADRVKRYKERRLDLEKKEEESGYIKQ